MNIRVVSSPLSVMDKIESRGIGEKDVQGALTADADVGDLEPVLHRTETGRRGGAMYRGFCRVPSSGRYLEVAFELLDDGTAWCYHAMDMRLRDRRRFQKRG